ncbi:MAG: hypothetical protein IJC25_07220, partial [Clostridia bacterium]|nr:hypothetical protein [Clostridia bacterium]
MKKTCLNGWWDIRPLFPDRESKWEEGAYLVPSFWNKCTEGVRNKGEKLFLPHPLKRLSELLTPDRENEYLYDAFGYPEEWSLTRTAWIRRSITVRPQPGIRYLLETEAIEPIAELFVNGVSAASHAHPTLPFVTDITDLLTDGENEIAFHITDYDYDEFGRITTPTGNGFVYDMTGIWQDVWLIERPEVYQSDVTVVTSVRNKVLTLTYEFTNASAKDCSLSVTPRVYKWDKTADDGCGQKALELTPFEIVVPAGSTVKKTVSCVWKEPELWNTETPVLYQLATSTQYETVCERFGFREIWIEGDKLMLNGAPLHLFSDWGHKYAPYCFTETWIRQWYRMIREANMNHTRLHTSPHPRIYLDLADELGIFVTDESGLHGSGGALATNEDIFWTNAAEHVRRFVRRDKNHPSVLLWSVENEVRWNTKGDEAIHTPKFVHELPRLRKLFNELDPTRPAYHEGDSSLWDEKAEQDILSRHYGREASGIGWWDHQKPLHSGEMNLYHYTGPNTTLMLGGDSVFADHNECLKYSAIDNARVVEGSRAEGVCCLGPWNLSCLRNLRSPAQDMTFTYDDYTTPGMKPLRATAFSSEMPFWDPDGSYMPDPAFGLQANAFRPFAAIDLSVRTVYAAGEQIERSISLVNDTYGEQSGVLTLLFDGTVLYQSQCLTLKRGEIVHLPTSFTVPAVAEDRIAQYEVRFADGDRIIDSQTFSWHVFAPVTLKQPRRPLLVYRPKRIARLLDEQGITYAEADLNNLPDGAIVLLERNTLEDGSTANRLLEDFLKHDGRVILAEQELSVFPNIQLYEKTVSTAFIRSASPVFDGLNDADLAFWGDEPYAKLGADTVVTNRLYRKPANTPGVIALADSGEGGFGDGDLDGAALIELRCGSGVLVAGQFEISKKLHLPVCQKLIANLLDYTDSYIQSEYTFYVASENDKPADLKQKAAEGATVLVNGLTDETAAEWSEMLGVELKLVNRDWMQAVKVGRPALLEGLSNEDVCGVTRYPYCPDENVNVVVCRAALQPTAGLEPLLVTPTVSLMEELCGREPLRAHIVTRFLFGPDNATESYVVTGRVSVGKGCIVINQFATDGTLPKYRRLPAVIETNCGGTSSQPLEGDGLHLPAG